MSTLQLSRHVAWLTGFPRNSCEISYPPIIFRSVLAVILFSVLSQAQGAGFYISEIGTPGSLGSAGVANPVNNVSADAAWTNPAGMTGIKSDHALAGMQVLVPKIEFDPSSSSTTGGDDGGNAGNVALIPSFFATTNLQIVCMPDLRSQLPWAVP